MYQNDLYVEKKIADKNLHPKCVCFLNRLNVDSIRKIPKCTSLLILLFYNLYCKAKQVMENISNRIPDTYMVRSEKNILLSRHHGAAFSVALYQLSII